MKYNKYKPLIKLMLLAAVSAIVIKILFVYDVSNSAVLYVAVPFVLSIFLFKFTSSGDKKLSTGKRLWNHFRGSTLIMLFIAVLLREGFVCVLMFMPIYYFFMLLSFFFSWLSERAKTKKGNLSAYSIPMVVALLAVEGTHENFTFSRYNEVTYSQIVQNNVDTLKQKLTQPIEFKGKRHWFLSAFPMPEYVGTVSLDEGDVRKYDFVYHRWFVTNTHKGSVDVKFTEVSDNHIKTNIEDSSYISGYMKLHGTEAIFEPISENQTKVTLTIKFDRTLDPIWYFEPLERFAVKKGIEYFVKEILDEKKEAKDV